MKKNRDEVLSTFFSPRKFLILMDLLLLPMLALIGKWAYTNLILYRYPLVMPVIKFSMWLRAVRMAVEVLRKPNQESILSFLLPPSSELHFASLFYTPMTSACLLPSAAETQNPNSLGAYIELHTSQKTWIGLGP